MSDVNKQLKQNLKLVSKESKHSESYDDVMKPKKPSSSTTMLDKMRQDKKSLEKEKDLGDLFESSDSSCDSTPTSGTSDEGETNFKNLEYPNVETQKNPKNLS